MRISRGTSLLELLLTIALGAVVLTAGARLLLTIRRLWQDEREALAARHAQRTAVALLTAELRGTAPRQGDLLRTSDTSVTLRAQRGLYRVCAAPRSGSGELDVARAGPAPRVPVAGSESVLVLMPGLAPSTDRWLHAAIIATGSASCTDSSAGWRLTLAAAGSAATLDSVQPGVPLRTFETLTYRLYADGSGDWWLGVRAWQGASWAATSPIAGPFAPRDGIALSFLDAAGAVVSQDTLVAQVVVGARVLGASPRRSEGRAEGPYRDSLFAVVAPRNR